MFAISNTDVTKINKWLKEEIYPPIVERQKLDPDIAPFLIADDDGTIYPYSGAVGGDITYSFTPTSLGTIFTVTHSSGAKLDLTTYEDW